MYTLQDYNYHNYISLGKYNNYSLLTAIRVHLLNFCENKHSQRNQGFASNCAEWLHAFKHSTCCLSMCSDKLVTFLTTRRGCSLM